MISFQDYWLFVGIYMKEEDRVIMMEWLCSNSGSH